jgi:transposase
MKFGEWFSVTLMSKPSERNPRKKIRRVSFTLFHFMVTIIWGPKD